MKVLPMVPSGRDSLIALVVLWFMCVVVVGLRIYSRCRTSSIGADDVAAVFAVALSGTTVPLCAIVFVSGVGWDFDRYSPIYPDLLNNLPFIMKITFAFTLVYIWSLTCYKLSQLALYFRIFKLIPRMKIGILVLGGFILGVALLFNFLFIFMCNPIRQQWSIDRVGHCMDQMTLLRCIIGTNLGTDILLVALPIRHVWNLKLPKSEKLAIAACFGLGIGCCVISSARLAQIDAVDLLGNLTGTSLTTFMLSSAELMLAGLCTNIPTLRVVYRRIRNKSTDVSKQERGHELGGSGQPKSSKWSPLHDMNNLERDTEEWTLVA